MGNAWKKAGLIGIGAVLGLLLSLNFSAMAEKEARLPIPYDDLQLFSAVFGRIKSDYVEPVSDDKLIKEAINGMVHGLDPHSDFLDADAYKELQVSTQGRFGGLGIEVGVEDGFIKVVSPIEDTPAFRAGIKAGDLIIKIDDIATRDSIPSELARARLVGERQPSQQFATPEQIGALVVFLCSDAAAQVRGAAIPVDGGWVAQ